MWESFYDLGVWFGVMLHLGELEWLNFGSDL